MLHEAELLKQMAYRYKISTLNILKDRRECIINIEQGQEVIKKLEIVSLQDIVAKSFKWSH